MRADELLKPRLAHPLVDFLAGVAKVALGPSGASDLPHKISILTPRRAAASKCTNISALLPPPTKVEWIAIEAVALRMSSSSNVLCSGPPNTRSSLEKLTRRAPNRGARIRTSATLSGMSGLVFFFAAIARISSSSASGAFGKPCTLPLTTRTSA